MRRKSNFKAASSSLHYARVGRISNPSVKRSTKFEVRNPKQYPKEENSNIQNGRAMQSLRFDHSLLWISNLFRISCFEFRTSMSLQAPHEGDEVGFLFCVQLRAEHEVEELDGVFERQQAVVVQVRRRVFDAAQRERLDRAVG